MRISGDCHPYRLERIVGGADILIVGYLAYKAKIVQMWAITVQHIEKIKWM